MTTVLAVACKSRINILLPPGVRVEMGGLGVSQGYSADQELESRLPPDAPVVCIKGMACKGTTETTTRPPGSRETS